jgi:hypothetical protein
LSAIGDAQEAGRALRPLEKTGARVFNPFEYKGFFVIKAVFLRLFFLSGKRRWEKSACMIPSTSSHLAVPWPGQIPCLDFKQKAEKGGDLHETGCHLHGLWTMEPSC